MLYLYRCHSFSSAALNCVLLVNDWIACGSEFQRSVFCKKRILCNGLNEHREEEFDTAYEESDWFSI